MMKTVGAVLAVAACALAGSAHAAGTQPGQWYVSPMLTYMKADDDRLVDNGIRGGQLGLGYVVERDWLVESVFQYHDFKGLQPGDQWGLGLDVIRRFNSEGSWSPYLLAGGGWLRTDQDGAARRNGAQFSAAAGILLRASDSVSLRGEYRLRGDASSPGLTDGLISLGFTMGFGAAPAPAPVPAPAPEPAPAPAPAPPPPQPPPAEPERPCPEPRPGQPVDEDGCALEIELPGVNFEFDSARLLASSERILDDAAEILQLYPFLRVEVQGHTDSRGSAAYNQQLSERRAQAVRDYLISRGVAPGNLTARGYGEERPIASNDTDEGRARNRRVVLSFIVD